MRQYLDAKQQYRDAILFFRMGDFYEMFYEDALTASRALELTLTSRSKDANGGGIPMCGVPFHAVDGYIARLVKKGFRVAICDQVEDPRKAKGLVKREVVRVVSPGTLTDANYLDAREPAFLMAVFFRGMDLRAELPHWLDAMLHSGEVLDLSRIAGPKVDKHSTGGVGDKISIPLAPLAAVCGVRVPMVSGRGLGHTGGTLDKLESIPGFRVDLPTARFVELVDRLGLCLIGQTAQIAPADRKLYALRDATATVESVPLIASSILSKKLAEGIDALVLDVKVGRGAFMKTLDDARQLAETMLAIGRDAGREVVCLLTDMDQPLAVR